MADKDDGLDNFDLDDDIDLGDLDIDIKTGIEDSITKTDTKTRKPVMSVINDTAKSFTEDFTDNRLGTILDIAKAAIPSRISRETDTIFNAAETISQQMTTQANAIKRETRKSMLAFKKYLPKNDNSNITKIYNKIFSAIGDAPASYEGFGATPTKAELAARQVIEMMGEKSPEGKYAEQFKEQLAFMRQKELKDIQANSALNIERIRKFLFTISDSYYRSSLDVNVRQLLTMKELLAVTKSGFEVSKAAYEAIVKNTGLPEVVKVHNSELVTRMAKERLVHSAGDALFKGSSPVDNIANKLSGTIKQIGEGVTGTLQSLVGNTDTAGSLGGMGMTPGSILGMLAADVFKSKIGRYAGDKLTDNDKGSGAIWDIKNSGADLRDTLDKYGRSDNSLSGIAKLASRLSGSDTNNFTVDETDPNAAAYLDNRTKDSVNRIIPELLSKILSEVTTSRELQTAASGQPLSSLGIGDPSTKELVYDPANSSFITKAELHSSISKTIKRDAAKRVAAPADELVRLLLDGTNIPFTSEHFKHIRNVIIATIFNKGKSSAALLEDKYFIEQLANADPELPGMFKAQMALVKKRAATDEYLQDKINNYINSIKQSPGKHKLIAADLVKRGLANEAISVGLLSRKEDGSLVGNYDKIRENIISSASSADISGMSEHERSLKELLKGKTLREKASIIAGDVGKRAFGEGDLSKKGSYSKGGYTKDGESDEEAGVVHRGEYVINNKKLRELVDHVKDGDVQSILVSVKKMAKDITTQSKEYSISTDKLSSVFKDFTNNIPGMRRSAADLGHSITDKAKDFGSKAYSYIADWDKLPEVERTALRLEYFASDEYRAGLTNDFVSWLKEFKRVAPGILEEKSGIISDAASELRDKILSPIDKLKEQTTKEITDRLTGKALTELTAAQEDIMRKEFFHSDEYQKGLVTNFDNWLASQGYRRNGTGLGSAIKKKFNLREMLRKSRALDRKIMGKFYGGIIKSPLTLAKLGIGLGKVGAVGTAKGILGLGKAIPGIRGAATSLEGLLPQAKVPTGTKALMSKGIGKAAGAVGKTGAYGASLVGDALIDTISAIPGLAILSKDKRPAAMYRMGATKRKLFGGDAPGTEIKDDSKKSESMLSYFKKKDNQEKAEAATAAKDKAKEAKHNKFLAMFKDKDREGNGSKKPGIVSSILSKSKDLLTPTTVLLGIAGGLAAMGVTGQDIKDGVKETVEGLKSVGKFLGGTWDYFKQFLGYIKNSFTYITQLPQRLTIGLREALSKIPGLGGLAPDAGEYAALDGKNNGIGTEPNVKDDGVSNIAAIGTIAGSYAGYKGINAGAKVVNIGTKVAGTTTSAIAKVSGIKDKLPAKKPVAPKASSSKFGIAKKLKAFIEVLKSKVISKFGVKGAGKVMLKTLAKFTPLGWIALLYEAGMTIYYMTQGHSFASAASLALIGVDVFTDDDKASEADPTEINTDNVIPIAKHKDYAFTEPGPKGMDYNLPESAMSPKLNTINDELRDELSKQDVGSNIGNRYDRMIADEDTATKDLTTVKPQQGPVIKVEPQVSVTVDLDKSEHLSTIATMSTKSVDIQTDILSVLGNISDKLDRKLDSSVKGNAIIEKLPKPAMDLRRRQAF